MRKENYCMSDIGRITNIQAWLESLVGFLKTNITASRQVVVIALSRKMPRFIEYLIENHPSDLISQLRDLLSDSLCTYTTEHAIPFVFKEKSENAKVLILDDIIVRGTTLLNVCEEIYQLTEIEPEYLCICQFDEFEELSIGHLLEGYTPQVVKSLEEVRDILLEISRCIRENGLPIDMEFPILHTDSGASFDPIVNQMEAKCPDSRSYSNEWSFTILQEDEINKMYNNDFAKIRVFKGKRDTKIVGYAPNVMSESELKEKSLFINEEYSTLWNKILDNIVDRTYDPDDIILSDKDNREAKLYHRICKSLAVVANYLFSLSMLIRHKQEFYVEGEKLCLHTYDLQLLVGKNLAETVFPKLTDFIDRGVNSQSRRRYVDTPPFLTPHDYEGDKFMDYDMERFFAVFNEDEISEMILNIFKVSYDMLDQDDTGNDNSDWTGGGNLFYLESFQSLFHLPIIGGGEAESEQEINKIVDDLIDENRIVPVYERTIGDDDPFNPQAYWRRYFKASHTIHSA